MLLLLQQNNLLADVTLVEVPDVVGQSQANGTAELEGVGFVVAVATAYSSTVPAGDIISQSPIAGTDYPAGGTVTITVSLGEEPQAALDTHDGIEAHKRLKRQARLYEEARRQSDIDSVKVAEEMREALVPDEPEQIATPPAPKPKRKKARWNITRVNDDEDVIGVYLRDEQETADKLMSIGEQLIERLKRLH